MLVSDGVGSLEVFELDAASRSATRLASVHSPRRSELPTHGMFVWAACELADGELLVCVQSAFEVDTGAAPGSHRPSKQIRKNVIADVVMSLQGDSAPYFVQIEPDEPAICVGAPSAFEPLIVATDADPSAALSSDIVPSVAPGSVAEVPDAMLVAGDVAAIPALPPYAWSQAGDEVTVYVHLARAPVDKTDLRILFHDSRISVRSLRSETPLLEGPLFDSIQSSECLWTLERSHLITLYMPKRNANTRWPHLFEHDDGVLETLDSNTLAEFRERMAKYHGPGDGAASPQRAAFRAAGSAAADAADDTMLGGSAHTRFQTVTERQESVDFEGASFCVGRFAVLQAHAGEHTRKRSHFASDSRCSSPHAPAAVRCAQTHQSLMPGLTWLGPVLGVPPTDPTQGSEADPAGFVAQSDVDGLVFGLASQMRFAHVGTVSALGFVQASKRDKKLVCVSRDVAYAFVLESRQYLYIYERDQPGQATARQLVVDLAAAAAAAGSDAGAVLGMAQLGPTEAGAEALAAEQAKLRLNREQEDGGAIGAGHWEQQRQAWRASHRPYDPQAAASQAFRSHPALVDVNETHYEAVYQSLITGRRFTQGVPLSFVTTILIHGWRKEGMVPMDWPPLAPGEGSR
nr:NudC domain-containing protein 1 [Polyrhizophydium stewartii]